VALEEWVNFKSTTWSRVVLAKVSKYMAAKWLEVLGDIPISRVDEAAVLRLYMDTAKKSPRWGNTVRGYLRQFLQHQCRLGRIQKTPIESWPTRKTAGTTRAMMVLPRDAEEKIFTCGVLSPEEKAYLRLAIRTGLRYGTISQLRAEMVNQKARTLWVPGAITKNGKDRTIPLVREVFEALKIPADPKALLFPGLPDVSSLNRALKRAAFKCGIPGAADLNTTNLRRTGMDRLVNYGVPLEVSRQALGWETTDVVVKHYIAQMNAQVARGFLEKI
jgi:integrase